MFQKSEHIVSVSSPNVDRYFKIQTQQKILMK